MDDTPRSRRSEVSTGVSVRLSEGTSDADTEPERGPELAGTVRATELTIHGVR
jgi:hypothetical protein